MIDYIIFDLDGTLIDTLEGLTYAVNKTLNDLNISYSYSKDQVKGFIGNGALKLFTSALQRKPTDSEFAYFLNKYEECQYVSKPFNGVNETLKFLEDKEIKLIIYSNKPNEILYKLIENTFKDIHFSYIQGQDFNYPPKPDVSLLNIILNKLNLSGSKGLFVGDSIVDIQTAKNIGLECLIMNYGYGDKQEMLTQTNVTFLDRFEEVKKYIWIIKKS